jgi:uncharacterized protein YigA (DUF484 family)
MIGTGDKNSPLVKSGHRLESRSGNSLIAPEAEVLRSRAQLRSLREQIENKDFLLKRLNAASVRLIQALELGDVYEAIAEIIANLVGSEEVAFFLYSSAAKTFSLAWSWGVDPAILKPFASGAGMLGRAVHKGASQFRDRQPDALLLPHEKNLTACIVLKSGDTSLGVIAIFGLLPQKNRFEWADFEILKFLEIYGAAAIQFHELQKTLVAT